MKTDMYLAVQDAMTEDERERALAYINRTYPTMRGAHIADFLQITHDADHFLWLTEPFFEEWGDVIPDEDGTMWAAALIALYIVGPPYSEVRHLVAKARTNQRMCMVCGAALEDGKCPKDVLHA